MFGLDNAMHEARILGKSRSEWYMLFGYLFRVYLGLVCLVLLGTTIVVSSRAYNGYCDSEQGKQAFFFLDDLVSDKCSRWHIPFLMYSLS